MRESWDDIWTRFYSLLLTPAMLELTVVLMCGNLLSTCLGIYKHWHANHFSRKVLTENHEEFGDVNRENDSSYSYILNTLDGPYAVPQVSVDFISIIFSSTSIWVLAILSPFLCLLAHSSISLCQRYYYNCTSTLDLGMSLGFISFHCRMSQFSDEATSYYFETLDFLKSRDFGSWLGLNRDNTNASMAA